LDIAGFSRNILKYYVIVINSEVEHSAIKVDVKSLNGKLGNSEYRILK